VSATITIIATPVKSPKQFKAIELEERRRSSLGWKVFPSRTGRHPDAVLLTATGIDLAVLELEQERDPDSGEIVKSFIIDEKTLEEVVPRLEALIDANRDATAQALVAKVGGTANIERVTECLKDGTWPEEADAAAEAAAFAKNLWGYGRFASLAGLGICWEYRGDFPLGDKEPSS
jgi:hypothetical protein